LVGAWGDGFEARLLAFKHAGVIGHLAGCSGINLVGIGVGIVASPPDINFTKDNLERGGPFRGRELGTSHRKRGHLATATFGCWMPNSSRWTACYRRNGWF
jgi:hypothetical protein